MVDQEKKKTLREAISLLRAGNLQTKTLAVAVLFLRESAKSHPGVS